MIENLSRRLCEMNVIFATRNGSRTLPIMLEALQNIRSPRGGWNVIAVDNNSTDNSMEILNSYKTKLPLTVLTESKPGKNACLNKGLQHANGSLIVFTDDDVIPNDNWLIKFEESAEENAGYDIFGGAIVPNWPFPPPYWVSLYANKGFSYALTDPDRVSGEALPNFIWGPNMMIRRKLFQAGHRFCDRVGPMGNKSYIMGSETELTKRLYALGHKCWFSKDVKVQHIIRKNQMAKNWLIMRSYRYGRSVAYREVTDGTVVSPKTIFGAPRFIWKRIVINIINIVYKVVVFDKRSVFGELMDLGFNLGSLKQHRLLPG